MKQELYDKLVAYILENQNKFYRLAFSYVKNQDDALDVVQNAVCKALAHYMDLRNEKAMKTWFYKIVLNESFALLNTKKKVIERKSIEEALKEAYKEQDKDGYIYCVGSLYLAGTVEKILEGAGSDA